MLSEGAYVLALRAESDLVAITSFQALLQVLFVFGSMAPPMQSDVQISMNI